MRHFYTLEWDSGNGKVRNTQTIKMITILMQLFKGLHRCFITWAVVKESNRAFIHLDHICTTPTAKVCMYIVKHTSTTALIGCCCNTEKLVKCVVLHSTGKTGLSSWIIPSVDQPPVPWVLSSSTVYTYYIIM